MLKYSYIKRKKMNYFNYFIILNKKLLLNPLNYLRFKLHTGRYIKISKMLKDGNLLDIGCGKPAEFMLDGSFLIFINRENSLGIDVNDLKNK
jgi:hypothetical protein